MTTFDLTDQELWAAKSLARMRSRAHRSGLDDNFVGACGEIAVKRWATWRRDCEPVDVAYWYPSLTGTADIYLGPRHVAVDVKTHRAPTTEILFPCSQAGRFAETGIEAIVWVAFVSGTFGATDLEFGFVPPVSLSLLGWSTALAVRDSQREMSLLKNRKPMKVLEPSQLKPLVLLPTYVPDRRYG